MFLHIKYAELTYRLKDNVDPISLLNMLGRCVLSQIPPTVNDLTQYLHGITERHCKLFRNAISVRGPVYYKIEEQQLTIYPKWGSGCKVVGCVSTSEINPYISPIDEADLENVRQLVEALNSDPASAPNS